MNRAEAIARLGEGGTWDIVIIGGGATGLASAFDAASRGYKTALIERDDFAQATSSRSTKLIHGGVRYLRQGRIGLVRSSLRERGLLLHNAPGLVHPRDFIVPAYSLFGKIYYGAGLKLYDLLAREAGTAGSEVLSRDETLAALPGIKEAGITGGIRYVDGQFDDAALAIGLAASAWGQGATLANYVAATGLVKRKDRVTGVNARDVETGAEFQLEAKIVINATGAFADEIRRLDDRAAAGLIVPSQGAHIVLPSRFLPGSAALMIPKTSDGRVLFAIPWLGRVLVGTTDVPLAAVSREPRPLPAEIDFLLGHAAKYLAESPAPRDILSTFAGIRPLVKGPGGSTSALSRDHVIDVSQSGLVTIAGGKWTTCRHMAEDVINRASALAALPTRPCRTAHLPISSPLAAPCPTPLAPCPSDSELVAAIDTTMARTVEDLLSRRTRSLYLDARASAALAPAAAALLARRLNRDPSWQSAQIRHFTALAAAHTL